MRVGSSGSTSPPELIPIDPNSGAEVLNTEGGGDGGIGGGANLWKKYPILLMKEFSCPAGSLGLGGAFPNLRLDPRLRL